MPTFSSVEQGEIQSKIIRFVVNLESGSLSKTAIHIYEIQFGMYPGSDNEILYLGGYRRICVANQTTIQLNVLNAKKDYDARQELTEAIKKEHNYVYV